MQTQTQAIQEFLTSQKCKVDLYSPTMEVQVNVLPNGERIPGKKTPQWSDGTSVWSAFRIPFAGSGADAEPHYTDKIMDWPLHKHVEAIGLTGWDWYNRVSRFVGFDFDSVTNHVKGLSDAELDELRKKIKEIPWITLRRSKSGLGYHLYVFFETPVETQNHTEHAALAKSILSLLSGLLDFDFNEKVDVCGGNLWIWHTEASVEKQSFTLIKQATQALANIPNNWREYLTLKKSRRGVPKRLAESGGQFDELLSRTRRVVLTEAHRELLLWFANNGQHSWWDAERGMLVCHTTALKKAHTELALRGLFETISRGTEAPYDHNCFCFPISNGAWNVFRYGTGTEEHDYWSRNPSGWTSCLFNKSPDLASVSRIKGGLKTKSGEFRFSTLGGANDVLCLLGAIIDYPASFKDRPCTLAPGKAEMEIVVTIPYEDGDGSLANWYIEGKQKNNKRWERIVLATTEAKFIEPPDEVIRHVTQPAGRAGWFILSRGRWVEKAKDDIKSAMLALDYSHVDREKLLGMAVLEDWEEVCVPFEIEYPGNRKWNKDAPQLAFDPEFGPFPTWSLVLDHVGKGIQVENNDWCRINNIQTGGEYLKLWLASMIRHPFEPLPYVFLWSTEQNTGKSTFPESVQLLLKDGIGYAKADQALKSTSGFNGELHGAIFCHVEEVDVSSRISLDRMKDWVTSPNLFIRALHRDGFLARNTTHWIQCSNDATYCPIFPGDTRVTVSYVHPFEGTEVPKPELISRLRGEAPYFLYHLLRLEIPPSNSRLRIPVISSEMKQELEDLKRSPLLDFMEQHCLEANGCIVTLDLFVAKFVESLPLSEQVRWSRDRILKEFPPGKFPKGIYNGTLTVGNMSIKGIEPRKLKTTPLIREGRKLV